MNATTCIALALTVVSGLLAGCATGARLPPGAGGVAHGERDGPEAHERRGPRGDHARQAGAGHAVFPTVTKGGLVVGGARGQGVLYEQGRHTAYCDLTQATVGVQVGGQTFSELLVFEDRAALDRFKAGQLAFAADASAVVLKTGVAADLSFIDSVAVVVSPIGGAMVEAAVGGQQFTCQAR